MRHIEYFGGKSSSANNKQETHKDRKKDKFLIKNTTLGHGDIYIVTCEHMNMTKKNESIYHKK